MFGQSDPPPLHVPENALRKPPAAVVDASGEVGCVRCYKRVPLATADIVGQGYRCAACSHAAELAALDGRHDPAVHMDPAERFVLATAAGRMIGVGLFAGAASIVVLAALGTSRDGLKLGVGLGIFAASMLVGGLLRRSAAR